MEQSLKLFPLFGELSSDELERLGSKIKERKYSADEVIFRQGETGGELYMIKEGAVRISLFIDGFMNFNEKMSVLRPGGFFGELSFFDGKAHSATAAAMEDTTLLILNQRDFDELIRSNPVQGIEIQRKIILTLVNIVRKVNDLYANMSSYFSPAR